jgi:hypothetical protein
MGRKKWTHWRELLNLDKSISYGLELRGIVVRFPTAARDVSLLQIVHRVWGLISYRCEEKFHRGNEPNHSPYLVQSSRLNVIMTPLTALIAYKVRTLPLWCQKASSCDLKCIFNSQLFETNMQQVLILTGEFAVDLGSFLRWGKPTLLCLWPLTHVFQSKIHLAQVQACFFFSCDIIKVIFCTVLCG